jgi:type II secretory pathway pseudopilin PulG
MRNDPSRARAAFTAIELLIVLVVVLVLIGMAVPALVGAMRKGSVNDAANSIVRVSSQARQFARTRQAPTGASIEYYGLVLVGDEQPNYVALTYGTTASKAKILLRPDGKPVVKLLFNRNVVMFTHNAHPPAAPAEDTVSNGLGGEKGWMYQYRTGYPIWPGSPPVKAVNIGVDPNWPSAITVDAQKFPNEIRHLSLRTLDGRYKTAIAIYEIGLSNVQDY